MRHFIFATLLLTGCSSGGSDDVPHAFDTGTPDTSTMVDSKPEAASDGGACTGACCCAGDMVDLVMCTDVGPTCKPGYNVYFGDDCDCLPDRDTPCCLPHVFDTGTPMMVDSKPEAASDGGACAGACCCAGDVVDVVMCTDVGPTCNPGYNVYFGDDCKCLPDRDTPCCLPHVIDGGSKG